MANRLTRIRDLLINTAAVTAICPAGDIQTGHFKDDQRYPFPGILIQGVGSPEDEQTSQQDLFFMVKCYDEDSATETGDVNAETLFQAVHLALTGKPEFGVFESGDEAAQGVLWRAQGIFRIDTEVGGQPLTEPAGGRRGAEFVLGTYKAIYPDT